MSADDAAYAGIIASKPADLIDIISHFILFGTTKPDSKSTSSSEKALLAYLSTVKSEEPSHVCGLVFGKNMICYNCKTCQVCK